ncbi:response regulator transcription factor [Aeromonas sp. FDAARGOS 1419]|uniref:response regulator transcription factor n=1 Tax=Aeromonas sp. FDAARGOS 1419 TaxID=2778068 RepID=UPI001C24595D|nr:response regulator transcription factor [Aeromonas sp. FDAARGOS 1419]QWZ78101.1 response regulator transcription factor [Aeromonas sp. FDAARGOS 1419]
MENNLKILIVDDHPAVRLAVKYVLNTAGYRDITQASSGVEAINQTHNINFDVIILDLDLPHVNGLEVAKRIRKKNRTVRILILSALITDVYIMRCYTAGVNGFMEKNEDIESLPSVVANLMKGFSYFPAMLDDKFSDFRSNADDSAVSCLSDRELAVFNRLVIGKTNLEIANELFLSNKTVSTYKTRIFKKLGVSNIAELIDISRDVER